MKPAGLALIAPFQSINRVPFGVNIFPKDRFPNIKRIPNVGSPLLVIHGENDRVIKPSHGKAIYDAHTGYKTLTKVNGAGHNDIWNKDEAYKSLFRFIDQNTR